MFILYNIPDVSNAPFVSFSLWKYDNNFGQEEIGKTSNPNPWTTMDVSGRHGLFWFDVYVLPHIAIPVYIYKYLIN